MKRIIAVVLFAGLAFLPSLAQGKQEVVQEQSKGMTNDDIIALVEAGAGEELIFATIRSAKATNFDVSPGAIVRLKRAKVPESVINHILERSNYPSPAPAERKRYTSFPEALKALAGAPIAVGRVERQGIGQGDYGYGGYGFSNGYATGQVDVSNPQFLQAYNLNRERQRQILNSYNYGYGGYGRGPFGIGGLGGFGGYGRYGGIYGGGVGGAGVYQSNYPLYSDLNPDEALRAAIQSELEDQLEFLKANLVAPATGPSGQLEILGTEAGIGRDSGMAGAHTWDTARYVLYATYKIDDEQFRNHGIDGFGLGQVASASSRAVGAGRTREAIQSGAEILSTIQTEKGSRIVEATLSVRIEEVGTRRILWHAKGVGRVDVKEVDIKYVVGVWQVNWQPQNASKLAKQMVRAVTIRNGL